MSDHDRTVWLVVPGGVDDPQRVSGGSVFDVRVREGLSRLGRRVRTVEVEAGASAAAALAPAAPHDVVLVDGLVALRAPDAMEAAAARVRVVVLAHMVVAAFDDATDSDRDAERRVLQCAHRIVVPSVWARDELVARGLAKADRIAVAIPGADDAPMAPGTPTGAALLCVGVVAAHKGQDTLVDALAELADDPRWTCTVAGSRAVDRAFADRVVARAEAAGLSGRIRWAGVLDRDALAAAYASADVLVAPSRTESYGIAVGDALRRGIPVVASRVGGLPEAARPEGAAILVPPGRPAALRDALRRWIEDPSLRERMAARARAAASGRPGWDDTARALEAALEEPW